MNQTPQLRYFLDQLEFRKWLEANHQNSTELLVGFYKIDSGKPSMTWPQSVDQALCFGWIDGIRRSVDKDSYCIRFTPRKAASIWSAVNIRKVEELTNQGLMQPSGFASFEKRTENKSKIYAYEQGEVAFSDDFGQLFEANKMAWSFFQALSPSYRKASINWVMTAKQETTRLKRLNELIAYSEAKRNKWKNY
jgi:uncharacterized protein YdeI (YjbR/CyaY-like superfamily)